MAKTPSKQRGKNASSKKSARVLAIDAEPSGPPPAVAVKTTSDVPPPSDQQRGPEVYTIPADQPFLKVLARGILDKSDHDPLKLSDYTILLPTREACKALRDIFVDLAGGVPAIMPRIGTPGDIGAEHASLRVASDPVLAQALMDLPPPVSHLQRQLVLAREIMKIPQMATSVEKAVQLGRELGRFLDDVQRQELDFRNIDNLAKPEFSAQWQKTAGFLKIITHIWPQILSDMGKIDPEEYRTTVIRIQALHWQRMPSSKPVIAAGFTHVTPAVGDLLKTVAALPASAVVLPGLEKDMDPAIWQQLPAVHPQWGLKRMTELLGVAPGAVAQWSENIREISSRVANPEASATARAHLMSEALRPAASLSLDAGKKTKIDAKSLSGMDLIACGTSQEEANVIALKMRSVLETPGRSATLVTPDRSLARRVSARLRHWGINVNDMGGGEPLSESPIGTLLRATASAAVENLAPVALLGLLKHPLVTLGEDKDDFLAKVHRLEDMALRGARPRPGFSGLKARLADAFNHAARKKTPVPADPAFDSWLERIERVTKPFVEAIADKNPRPLSELLELHIRTIETLATTKTVPGAERLWQGEEGMAASRFLSELREVADSMPPLKGSDYAGFIETLMGEVQFISRRPVHPNLLIMTPRQARLIKPDVMIAGSLNEGVWPGHLAENPWLSRDMIAALGLPPPEVAVGQAAHDFVSAVSTPDVLMTRAMRSGSAQTVASPFLERLETTLEAADLLDKLASRDQLAEINSSLTKPAKITPMEPPAPTPPVSARPKQLPATAVETLVRDPYSIYAKYVLDIRPKAPIDADPSFGERGTFIHKALETFVKKFPDSLPRDAYGELLKMGEDSFKERMDSPEVQAFWWPRFERIAKWFVDEERHRRKEGRTLATEVRGKLEIDLGDSVFTLTAIADRIDRTDDDRLVIIDYKTGEVPTQKAVRAGLSPQLPIEALIARRGGFDGIEGGDIGALEYWKLSGGRPAGKVTSIDKDMPRLEEEAFKGLSDLVRSFSDAATPYLAVPRPREAPRYNNYEHLERADEWNSGAPEKNRKESATPVNKAKVVDIIPPEEGTVLPPAGIAEVSPMPAPPPAPPSGPGGGA